MVWAAEKEVCVEMPQAYSLVNGARGQASAIFALLANIAFRAGRKLQWDASNDRFAQESDFESLLFGKRSFTYTNS
tara:strand:+ start:809 stop:1036 length:228 start_codon:yes stop_codon:yes gene_type:complete